MTFLNAMQQLIAHPEKKMIHPGMSEGDYIYWKPSDDPFSAGEFYWHKRGVPDVKANLQNSHCTKWEVK